MRSVEFFRFARFNSQGLQGSILKVCKVQFLRFARFSSEIRVPFLHSRATGDLTDFNETLPVLRVYPKTQNDKLVSVLVFFRGR